MIFKIFHTLFNITITDKLSPVVNLIIKLIFVTTVLKVLFIMSKDNLSKQSQIIELNDYFNKLINEKYLSNKEAINLLN